MPVTYKHIDITQKEIEKNLKVLGSNLEKFLGPFLEAPFNEHALRSVVELKEKLVADELKYIVVIGIGGSNLGAKAVYDAMYGYYENLDSTRYPKMIFIDTVDPQKLEKVGNILKSVNSLDEVLINVISKSGTTLETVTNFELLTDEIPTLEERLVVTTEKGSPLFKIAKDLDTEILTIPEKIGGRYSVFTVVGLFPLACLGIDILKFLEGAMTANNQCIPHRNSNTCVQSSAFLKNHYLGGKTIHEFFTFEPNLESLGKWYEQLIAESLGKKEIGITPVTSIGSTDLHSKAQLDIGGPENKMVTFVYNQANNDAVKEAIYTAAVKMYKADEIPVCEIEFDEINELNLGYFMQHKMIEIAFLGNLLNVDPYTQPDVEDYKSNAKEILKK